MRENKSYTITMRGTFRMPECKDKMEEFEALCRKVVGEGGKVTKTEAWNIITVRAYYGKEKE